VVSNNAVKRLSIALSLCVAAACGGSSSANQEAQAGGSASPNAVAVAGANGPVVAALKTACVDQQGWVDTFRQANGRTPMLRVAPVKDDTGLNLQVGNLRNSLETAFLEKGGVEIAAPLEAMAQLQSMQTLSGADVEGDGPPMGDFILATVMHQENPDAPDAQHYVVDLSIVAVDGGAVACRTSLKR